MLKKTLSMILALIFVLMCVASCAKERAPEAEVIDTEAETNATPDSTEVDIEAILADSNNRILVKEGTSNYVIVVPADDADAKKVADDLADGIQSLTGAELTVVDDSTAEAEYEILIGATNRAASTEAYASIRYNDYKIASTEKKIAVAAMRSENLMLASKRLISEAQTHAEDGKSYMWIEVEYNYEKLQEYTLAKLTVAGNDIKDYVIAYGDGTADAEYAELIQAMLIVACGRAPKLVKASETEAVSLEILVGETNRAESATTGDNTYDVKVSGNKLVFYYEGNASAKKAWAEYEDAFNTAMKALAAGTTEYELNALTVSGKIEALAAGQVIYTQNFDSLSASDDFEAIQKDIGWTNAFHRAWKNDPYLEITENKTLKVDGGWTGYYMVDGAAMEGAFVYTIKTDIAFIGEELGAFEIHFNSDSSLADLIAINTIRKNSNVFAFRNANASDIFTGTNDTPMAELNQLGCAFANMVGDSNSAAKTIKVASGPVEGTKDGVQQCEFITDSTDQPMYGKMFTLEIEVDCIKGIANAYVNGELIASLTTGVLANPGSITILAQNSLAEMDNITVTTGTRDGLNGIPDSNVVTPPAVNKVLYSEKFDRHYKAVNRELGWIATGLVANNPARVTYTADNKATIASEWAMSAIIDSDKMTGVNKYTMSMDLTVKDPSDSGSAVANIIFNDSQAVSGMTSNNRRAMILSFRECNDQGAATANGGHIGVNLIKFAPGQVLVYDKYTILDGVDFNEEFNVEMYVDNADATITVSINDVAVLEYKSADFAADKQMTTTSGAFIFWVQNTTLIVDNILIENNNDASPVTVYSEDFTVADKDAYTGLGWTNTGLATNPVRFEYNNGQGAFEGRSDSMSAIIDKATLDNGTTTYKKYMLEMDVTLAASDTDTSASFNLIFNDAASAASLNSSNVNGMMLSFRDCNASGAVTNNGGKIGVTLMRVNNGTVNVYDAYTLIDADFGEQFNVQLVVDNEAATITVFINDVAVLEYESADFAADKQMTTTSGALILEVQNTDALIDNIVVGDFE